MCRGVCFLEGAKGEVRWDGLENHRARDQTSAAGSSIGTGRHRGGSRSIPSFPIASYSHSPWSNQEALGLCSSQGVNLRLFSSSQKCHRPPQCPERSLKVPCSVLSQGSLSRKWQGPWFPGFLAMTHPKLGNPKQYCERGDELVWNADAERVLRSVTEKPCSGSSSALSWFVARLKPTASDHEAFEGSLQPQKVRAKDCL